MGATGYGEKTAVDGYGFPIYLEFYGGRLRLTVWADINSEDPTHEIDLEGAHQDARDPGACCDGKRNLGDREC